MESSASSKQSFGREKKQQPSWRILLHPAQKQFLDSTATFVGFVGGRGSGKSFIGAYDLLLRARNNPGRAWLAVAPTYSLLNDITLPVFRDLGEKTGWVKRYRVARRTLDIYGGGEIRLRSGENPEKLRGPNLSGVWIDEASVQVKDVYLITIGSLREGNKMGRLTATFTPKGKSHWTYEVFGDPETRRGRSIELVESHTRNNPFLPQEFEDTIRGEFAPLMADQELAGKFIDPPGALFKRSWFRYYQTKSSWWILDGRGVQSSDCLIFATADVACSTKTSADFGVICVWARSNQDDLLLLDVMRDKLEAPQLLQSLKASHQKWNWKFCAVEQEGSGLPVIQQAKHDMIPMKTVSTLGKDKVTRSIPAQIRAQDGKLWLPHAGLRYPWFAAFDSELGSFPECDHDDQVDCTSIAANVIQDMFRNSKASRPILGTGMPQVF